MPAAVPLSPRELLQAGPRGLSVPAPASGALGHGKNHHLGDGRWCPGSGIGLWVFVPRFPRPHPGRRWVDQPGGLKCFFSRRSIQALPLGPLIRPWTQPHSCLRLFCCCSSVRRAQRGCNKAAPPSGVSAGGHVGPDPSGARACSWVASPPGGRLALHRGLGGSIYLEVLDGATSAHSRCIVRAASAGPRPHTSALGSCGDSGSKGTLASWKCLQAEVTCLARARPLV